MNPRIFAFIAGGPMERAHEAAAAQRGIELVELTVFDPFSVCVSDLATHPQSPFDGVAVDHPAMAMRLAPDYAIGVFRRGELSLLNAAPLALHVYAIKSSVSVEVTDG